MNSRNNNPVHADIGIVVSVDTADFTLTVRTNSGTVYDRVQWVSPYSHKDGQGIYVMPQVNTRVLLMWAAGSEIPYVVGWIAPVDENRGFRGQREEIKQGDIMLKTPDGAYLALRNGGVIELFSNALNSWLFIPLHNITRGTVENLEIENPGGRLHWKHDRETRRATMKWLFRDMALNDRFQLLVEAGYIDDGSLLRVIYDDPAAQDGEGGVCQLRVGDLGNGHVFDLNIDKQIDFSFGRDTNTGTLARVNIADGDEEAIALEFGRNVDTGALLSLLAVDQARTLQAAFGKVSSFEGADDVLQLLLNSVALKLGVKADGQTLLHIGDGNLKLQIDSDGRVNLKIREKLTINLDALGNVSMGIEGSVDGTVAGNVDLAVDGNVDVSAGGHAHITSNDIKIGSSGSSESLMLGDAFRAYWATVAAWMDSHLHTGNMGGPTSPALSPSPPFDNNTLSDIAKTEK